MGEAKIPPGTLGETLGLSSPWGLPGAQAVQDHLPGAPALASPESGTAKVVCSFNHPHSAGKHLAPIMSIVLDPGADSRECSRQRSQPPRSSRLSS